MAVPTEPHPHASIPPTAVGGAHETVRLRLRLHGPFHCAFEDGVEVPVRSAKMKALVALLATAPDGKRARAWLQDMLWSLSGPEHGRASLRQELSALRRTFGERFDPLFAATSDAVTLRLERVEPVGGPADGEFLEGLDLHEEGFSAWLRERRQGLAGAAESVPAVPIVPVPTGPIPRPMREHLLPTLAVVPFTGMDRAPDTMQLGDAIAQEVTRTLSRSPLFDVISHLSTRAVKPEIVDLNRLRELLGADYVVCGSLRTRDGRVRVDVDFVDANSGTMRWTREHGGEVAGFLGGDDDLPGAIARDAAREVMNASLEPVATLPLPDVDSHALVMSGISLMHRTELASFARARACLEEVAERAPRSSTLQAWLSKWYVLSVQQGWSTDLARDNMRAHDHTKRALDINPACPFSLAMSGFVDTWLSHRLDTAVPRYDEAVRLDPNNAFAWLLKGVTEAFAGNGEAAVLATDRARSLSPLDPHAYFFDTLAATARLTIGDAEGALALAERSAKANPRHASTLRTRTIALQMLGRGDEARAAAGELLRRDPGMTIRDYIATHPAGEFPTGREWAAALEAAGVPKG